ncbi:hypothetical protein SORBI_3010G002201 [Sorghum bicolor]|uniref:Plant heme peroxidase family profile domain-containing protein n=1 Tax=Sorghum bicolor TaxID=4558 RepID=A0A1W0VQX3_SORBI|nr:hypothetical protein SORBI_3010G002201 [Sorghum bicolor]
MCNCVVRRLRACLPVPVNGCDASVVVHASVLVSPLCTSSSTAPERTVEINLSLPRDAFDVVARAKAALESVCPGAVSCADVLVLAARALCGDPRRATVPRRAGPPRLRPLREMVALVGSHTMGFSHCTEFAHRIRLAVTRRRSPRPLPPQSPLPSTSNSLIPTATAEP